MMFKFTPTPATLLNLLHVNSLSNVWIFPRAGVGVETFLASKIGPVFDETLLLAKTGSSPVGRPRFRF